MELTRKSFPAFRNFALAALLVAGFVAPLRAADTMDEPAKAPKNVHLHYLAAGKPDAATLLTPPPQLNSPEQSADMAIVRSVSQAAPANDTAMALSEKSFSVYTFAPVVGSFFQSNTLSKTTAFFERVQTDAEIVTDKGKEFFKRPRPYTTDPALASGKLEKSFSYPSGHSTESMVLALVLAEVFPDKHEAIIARAREIGWHRIEIARHYPTDIYAGRVLAQAIVRKMNDNADFQKDLAEAKKEISSAFQMAKETAKPLATAAH